MIVTAEHDRFVYNRAALVFARKSPTCKVFMVPNALHELLHETSNISGAVMKTTIDYLTQKTDDVTQAVACSPLLPCDNSTPLYSLTETITRSCGVLLASVGVVLGLTMIFGDFRSIARR